ncbi:fatty acid desaturase family protein [Pandoraea sp. SD6-2]|nr:fatty acid desaturase family protein [Pandoraea sp. SD6-2]
MFDGGSMVRKYTNLELTRDQKRSIKALCERNNYRGVVSLVSDYVWILAACALSLKVHPLLYPLSILIIGTRQRALASLFHDASHGTLFRFQGLNRVAGRVFCGWPVMQSMLAYRRSHVIAHHARLGDAVRDPDFRELNDAGVYETPRGPRFFRRFVLSAIGGRLTIRYIKSLLLSRLSFSSRPNETQIESWLIVAFHVSIAATAYAYGWLGSLMLFWWIPLVLVFPLVGWFSELSEHYPFMEAANEWPFSSRNRYSFWVERLFIGMHGDSFHLTHHLLPGVPHWHLAAATRILRADRAFAEWDDRWGGIFSSDRKSRVSFIHFVKTPSTP